MQTLLTPIVFEPVFVTNRDATFLALRGQFKRLFETPCENPFRSSQEATEGPSDSR
jgi:hypothetical protein